MPKRHRVVDHRGRTWTATKTARRDADAEDFRFWFEELSPAQRGNSQSSTGGRSGFE